MDFTNIAFIIMFNRSTPHGLHYQATVLGLHFYDGWVYADHNTFTDFYDDEYKLAGAISFKAMRSIRDLPFIRWRIYAIFDPPPYCRQFFAAIRQQI